MSGIGGIARAAAAAGALYAWPVAAQVRPVPTQPASAATAAGGVAVYLLNETPAAQTISAPATVEVTAADGARLRLAPRDAAPVTVAPNGFAAVTYVVAPPAAPIAVAASDGSARAVLSPGARESFVESSRGPAGAFLDRLRPAEPIYAVAGLGDAGAKLQFSVGLQPFVGDGLLSHLRLAYTQTFFWAVDQPSGPVRDTNYSPEALLDLPLGRATILGIGYRHDSNGEGPLTSVDFHRIIARLSHRFDLGGGWRADVTPSAWVFVGGQGVARDLDRYWGYTGLDVAVERPGSIKLELIGRGNPATGKGSLEGFLSYPLMQAGVFGLYLVGEGFTGYGEALTRYNLSDRHLRLGIAVTR